MNPDSLVEEMIAAAEFDALEPTKRSAAEEIEAVRRELNQMNY